MKVAIVIILSLVLAFSGGLLIYGSTLGDHISFQADLGDLTPPENPEEYAPAIAAMIAANPNMRNYMSLNVATNPSKNPATFAVEVNGWYDVFGKHDPATSLLIRYADRPADLAANLIIGVTYNHNRAKQFCMMSHYEIITKEKTAYSDNMRVKQKMSAEAGNRFYQSLAWTGTLVNPAQLRATVNGENLEYSSTISDYDEVTGQYDFAWPKKDPTINTRNPGLEMELPYKTYDLLTLPIYLGSGDDDEDGVVPQAVVDSSVIDAATVQIEEPTQEKPYYVLSFSEDPKTAQSEVNLYSRLKKALGNQMDDITINRGDFVFEIWECGLLRQVTVSFDVNAKVSGKKGDATINMSYKFYYDDYNCSIRRLFESLDLVKYLSPANQALVNNMKKV